MTRKPVLPFTLSTCATTWVPNAVLFERRWATRVRSSCRCSQRHRQKGERAKCTEVGQGAEAKGSNETSDSKVRSGEPKVVRAWNLQLRGREWQIALEADRQVRNVAKR